MKGSSNKKSIFVGGLDETMLLYVEQVHEIIRKSLIITSHIDHVATNGRHVVRYSEYNSKNVCRSFPRVPLPQHFALQIRVSLWNGHDLPWPIYEQNIKRQTSNVYTSPQYVSCQMVSVDLPDLEPRDADAESTVSLLPEHGAVSHHEVLEDSSRPSLLGPIIVRSSRRRARTDLQDRASNVRT